MFRERRSHRTVEETPMEFQPEWVTAAAAALTIVVSGVNFVIVRPLSQKMTAQQDVLDDQSDQLNKIRDAQELRIAGVKTEQGRSIEDLRDRMELHERNDVERFDDQGERMESRIDGLRREMVAGHSSAVAQIKADQASAIGEINANIRALTTRIDNLPAAILSSLSRFQAGHAPGDD
jgi:hypothetical protein